MNHHCLNASVPQHLYGHVASDILQGLDGRNAQDTAFTQD
jgi:hypothetical protein